MLNCSNVHDEFALPENVTYFKEDIINEILSIPAQKPDMERVLEAIVTPEIVSYKLICTEKGLSSEGQMLTGLKLLVKVRLKDKISYVANYANQSVHAAHFESVKTMFIVLPEEIDGEDSSTLIKTGELVIKPYVECVETRMLNKRTIQECIMLFLNIERI